MGKIAHRGQAAMASPTAASLWEVSKPKDAGPVAKRGQAAMGTTSMTSSSSMPSSRATPLYGFECQPIKNYAGAIKEPAAQDLPPRPQRQEVEEVDSDGGFELLHEDKEVDPTRRHVQEEGRHQAMAMAPPGGSGGGDDGDGGRDRRPRHLDDAPDAPDVNIEEEEDDEEGEDHPRHICTTIPKRRRWSMVPWSPSMDCTSQSRVKGR
eukprot:s70_g14.t1